MAEKKKKVNFDKEIVDAVMEMKRESRESKWDRMKQNKLNWDLFHGRGKFSHKQEGQSTEFLHKSALAAEQITALFKQSLMNFDKWIKVEYNSGFQDSIFDTSLAQNLLRYYLEAANVKTVISDAVKTGLHESVSTIKLAGAETVVPRYISNAPSSLRRSNRPEWRLLLSVISAEDYYPDPHAFGGPKLYEIHSMLLDKYSVMQKAKTDENPDGIYDAELVKELPSFTEREEDSRKKHNQGEDVAHQRAQRRRPILLDEFWGTVLDRDGNVMELEDGTKLANVVLTIANEKELIRQPTPNPRWAATSPIISAPLLRVPGSTWGKAIMDSAGSLNITLNELFNLMLDGGLGAVHGIKQLHEAWLDPVTRAEISKGIPAGTTLLLNETAPVGAKALERVDTGSVPADVLSFFNIVSQLFAENALSNEISLGGTAQKQVRATEVVASQQSISGIFDGLSGDFEDVFVERLAVIEALPEETDVHLQRTAGHDVVENRHAFEQCNILKCARDALAGSDMRAHLGARLALVGD